MYLFKLQNVFVQLHNQCLATVLRLSIVTTGCHQGSHKEWADVKGGWSRQNGETQVETSPPHCLVDTIFRKVLKWYVWAKLILKFTDIRIMRSEGRFPVGLKCLQSLKLFEKSLNRWNFLKSSSIIETFKKVPQSLKLLTEFSNKVFSRASHGSLHRNS